MHWNGICETNQSRKRSKTRFHFEFDMIFSTVSFFVFDVFFVWLSKIPNTLLFFLVPFMIEQGWNATSSLLQGQRDGSSYVARRASSAWNLRSFVKQLPRVHHSSPMWTCNWRTRKLTTWTWEFGQQLQSSSCELVVSSAIVLFLQTLSKMKRGNGKCNKKASFLHWTHMILEGYSTAFLSFASP